MAKILISHTDENSLDDFGNPNIYESIEAFFSKTRWPPPHYLDSTWIDSRHDLKEHQDLLRSNSYIKHVKSFLENNSNIVLKIILSDDKTGINIIVNFESETQRDEGLSKIISYLTDSVNFPSPDDSVPNLGQKITLISDEIETSYDEQSWIKPPQTENAPLILWANEEKSRNNLISMDVEFEIISEN